MPTQALGTPPPDLRGSGEYQPYPPPSGRPPGRRPGSHGGLGADRSKAVDYTLKGLGLLGVALVSGFLWFLIRNDPGQPTTPTSSSQTTQNGVYSFQAFHGATVVTDCAAHATEQVKSYLSAHPCVSLTRSLYTASLTDGQKVVTSVAVVQMGNSAAAGALRRISDGDNTGHVTDLVEDGTVIPNGPSDLQEAGYSSTTRGSRLIVVMTEYVDGGLDTAANLRSNDTALKAVSQDAINQGIGQGG
jgi:hypothetical protein